MKKSRSSAPVVLLSFLLLLAGCSRSAAPSSGSAPSPHAGGEGIGVAGGSTLPLTSADRSLVVTMDVSLTVANIDDASTKIRSAVEAAGGFIADAQDSGSDDARTAHLELRIPVDKARGVRSRLSDLGTVNRASEKVEDVTAERADLEARLHNARVQEKRVLEIMSTKAATVGELVEAEKELARVRENIERLEAQERTMKSKIQLATIRVSLTTKSPAAYETPGVSFSKAGKAGFIGAKAVAVYSGMAILAAAPIVAPIAVLLFGIAAVVRRRSSSRATSPIAA